MITWRGLAQLAGLGWFAGISARLLNMQKNQLHDYREKSQAGRALQNVGMEWNEVE